MKKSKFKILSLSHSEDTDGIGAQSIIYRYFIELKKAVPLDLIKNKNEISDDVEVICLRTDYVDFLYYWAAIFASNLNKFDDQSKYKSQNSNSDFFKKWEYFCKILFNVDDSKININPIDKIGLKTRENIINLSNRLDGIDLIFVTDLGSNYRFKTIFPVLKSFKISLAYFDHHEHEEDTFTFYSKYCSVCIINKSICASQIVQKYFLPDDSIAKQIAYYAADSDFHRYESNLTDKFQAIIGKFMYDYEKIDSLRDLFVKGGFEDPLIDKLNEEVTNWERKEEKYLIEHIYTKRINLSGLDEFELVFGISELRPGRGMRYIQKNYNKIFRNKGTEEDIPNLLLSLGVISMKIAIRSNKFNVYDIAKVFGGGGHVKRAGFAFPLKFVMTPDEHGSIITKIKVEDFLEEILNILKKLNSSDKR
ncbi:MAG: DHH family phosphoesterase [Promethearchaeota archaeon]